MDLKIKNPKKLKKLFKSIHEKVYFVAEYATFAKEKEQSTIIHIKEERFYSASKKRPMKKAEAKRRAEEMLNSMNKGSKRIGMLVKLISLAKVKPVFVADDYGSIRTQYYELRQKKIEEL